MSTYRRAPGLLVRRCPDRVLVLGGGKVHTLDGPATELLLALEAPVRPDALAHRLAERYEGVDVADVVQGLEVLRAAQLVECTSA